MRPPPRARTIARKLFAVGQPFWRMDTDVAEGRADRPLGGLMLSIGSMKAGTSWLFEILKDHPDLETVPIKEIHYFWEKHGSFSMLTFEQRKETVRFHVNALLPSLDAEASGRFLRWCETFIAGSVGDGWFSELFPRRRERKFCADFSNMTALADEGVWDHARALCEELRVVYTIREPLDRLWSHVRFHAQLTGAIRDISQYTPSQFERFMVESGCYDQGRYARVIDRLKGRLAGHEWKLLYYDDIRDRPAELLRQVELFLGIEPRQVARDILAHVHSAPEKVPMPDAFRSAARRHVDAELEALQRQGTAFPGAWLRDDA